MDKSFDKLEEAIHLATQEDVDAIEEDNKLKRFEKLVQKFQLQQRLVLEGELQKEKRVNFKLNEDVNSRQELAEKVRQAMIKNDESMQIHMVYQKAIEASQFSLVLQSETENLPGSNADEELVRLSVEYINLCLSNLAASHQLENLDYEIKQIQEKMGEIQMDMFSGKPDPEAKPGPDAEKIARVRAELETLQGRYNFTRYITQVLLMTSEKDFADPATLELFLKCGESSDW